MPAIIIKSPRMTDLGGGLFYLSYADLDPNEQARAVEEVEDPRLAVSDVASRMGVSSQAARKYGSYERPHRLPYVLTNTIPPTPTYIRQSAFDVWLQEEREIRAGLRKA